MSDDAQIAREIADITIEADNLYEFVSLKKLSKNMVGRIRRNYACIVGINAALILLGVTGRIPPAVSALLRNTPRLIRRERE